MKTFRASAGLAALLLLAAVALAAARCWIYGGEAAEGQRLERPNLSYVDKPRLPKFSMSYVAAPRNTPRKTSAGFFTFLH